MEYRQLTDIEQQQLRQQGCYAQDWSKVLVREGFSADRVREVRFSGTVKWVALRAHSNCPVASP